MKCKLHYNYSEESMPECPYGKEWEFNRPITLDQLQVLDKYAITGKNIWCFSMYSWRLHPSMSGILTLELCIMSVQNDVKCHVCKILSKPKAHMYFHRMLQSKMLPFIIMTGWIHMISKTANILTNYLTYSYARQICNDPMKRDLCLSLIKTRF